MYENRKVPGTVIPATGTPHAFTGSAGRQSSAMPLLFAYGTLLDPRVQRRVFGRQLDGRADTLAGFVRSTLDPVGSADGDAPWPDIAPSGDASDVVTGEVFAIGDADLAAADAYETDAYVRHRVTLGSGADAWVYVGSTSAAR